MSDNKSYEYYSTLIDETVRKHRSKWRLDAIKWFDFEDVEQIIKSHIAIKWHMWDQERPLGPWLNRVITNKMWNLLRNHYGSYVKPCSNCIYAKGDDCLMNTSGEQDNSCAEYAKWQSKKRYGLELRTASSIEDVSDSDIIVADHSFDYNHQLERLDVNMKIKLSTEHYQAYRMIFFDQCSEEDVARFMGYKISESSRKLGYRQVKNLKRKFYETAVKILKEQDVSYGTE